MVKKQKIKRGKLFRHLPFHHQWHRMDRKSRKWVLKETPYGTLTTYAFAQRCLVCGLERFKEDTASFDNKPDRKWKMKQTPDDTSHELFDVPK